MPGDQQHQARPSRAHDPAQPEDDQALVLAHDPHARPDQDAATVATSSRAMTTPISGPRSITRPLLSQALSPVLGRAPGREPTRPSTPTLPRCFLGTAMLPCWHQLAPYPQLQPLPRDDLDLLASADRLAISHRRPGLMAHQHAALGRQRRRRDAVGTGQAAQRLHHRQPSGAQAGPQRDQEEGGQHRRRRNEQPRADLGRVEDRRGGRHRGEQQEAAEQERDDRPDSQDAVRRQMELQHEQHQREDQQRGGTPVRREVAERQVDQHQRDRPDDAGEDQRPGGRSRRRCR